MNPVPEPAQLLSPAPSRAGLSPADLRRKIHARLAEKIDPLRTRHKPLSLVRQDARRAIDQLLDTECPTLTRSDRDKLVDDILVEGVGFGPFEELFRDETIKEFQILASCDVIVRKNDAWQTSPIKLRDPEQLRQMLARFAEVGESLSGPLVGGVDVRLLNGFRVVAVLPPDGFEQLPLVWFIRGMPLSGSGVIAGPRSGSLGVRQTPPADAGFVSLAPSGSGSEVLPSSLTGRHASSTTNRMPQPPASVPQSGRMNTMPPSPPPARIPPPEPTQDLYIRDRQRITERMIMKLASAGVFDLAAVPLPELRRFVLLAVVEYSEAEKLGFGTALQERLALEILAAMNR